jgi:hypothetical protein
MSIDAKIKVSMEPKTILADNILVRYFLINQIRIMLFKEPGTGRSTTKFQNQVTGNVELRGILDIYITLENKHASFLAKGFTNAKNK